MTAKHRRPKSNHKHEDNNSVKSEAAESEVAVGADSHALHLVLFLMIVVGGAAGAWFCLQQHRTLTHLTDNLAGMQTNIVKLQSYHEEIRQSSSKQSVSEGIESRLNALEDAYTLTQKQVGMALATAEQLRASDLPAQVLSLHTEMKARVAEMQQAAVSLEQLDHLETVVRGKSEEIEGVRVQVEGLATLGAELSREVEVLTGSLGETEAKLEEGVGQVAVLSATLNGQAAAVLGLKEQLDTQQAQLEANTLEIDFIRDLLEGEQAQWLQQASVEEQLNTVRQSLQDQTSAARSLTSGLGARLESIQKQVNQLMGEIKLSPEPEEDSEAETAPADEEEERPPADLEREAFIPEEAQADGGQATEDGVEEESSIPGERGEASEEEPLPMDVENEASIPEEAQADGGEATEEDVEEEASIPEENGEATEEEALPIELENEPSVPEEARADGEEATEEETPPIIDVENEAATEEEEEEMPPADVEEEASSTEEADEGGEEAAASEEEEEEMHPVDVEKEASRPEEEAADEGGDEAAATEEEEEEEMHPVNVEEEASSPEEEADEGGEAASQHEAPVEEDSVTDESAPSEEEVETVNEDQSEEEELDSIETAEEVQNVEEDMPEEEAPERPEVQEESALEEEKLASEEDLWGWDEEERDVADEDEPLEDDSLTEDDFRGFSSTLDTSTTEKRKRLRL